MRSIIGFLRVSVLSTTNQQEATAQRKFCVKKGKKELFHSILIWKYSSLLLIENFSIFLDRNSAGIPQTDEAASLQTMAFRKLTDIAKEKGVEVQKEVWKKEMLSFALKLLVSK